MHLGRTARALCIDAAYSYARLVVPGSVCLCVCASVCVLVTTMSPARTVKSIENRIPFLRFLAIPGINVLNKGAHWRHMANTMDPISAAKAMWPVAIITLSSCNLYLW